MDSNKNNVLQKIYASFSFFIVMLVSNVSCTSVNGLSEPDGEDNGHGYVDLGLPSGTLWATMNVGANAIDEVGNLYAWNARELADVGPEFSGTRHDVAYDKWEGSWQMPRKAQFEELQDTTLCTWTWISIKNSINGFKVTSKINEKSIFLPAAGLRVGGSIEEEGYDGYYNAASKCVNTDDYNYFLVFHRNSNPSIGGSDVYYGRSIRPVICSIPSSELSLTNGYVAYNNPTTASILSCKIDSCWGAVLNHGVCWNTTGSPTLQDSFHVSGNRGVPSFNAILTGLKTGETYYIRTYATNKANTYYSKEIVYIHRETSNYDSLNRHHFVDLGLPSGTKWATKNIGATTPEGYGDFYAWGEIESKDDYSWNTYEFFFDNNGNNVPYDSKWNTEPNELTDLGRDIAGTKYDVAHVRWGEKWEMPSKAQMEELLNPKHCEWIWTTINGVNGYKVISKINGNSIFLPASGEQDGKIRHFVNKEGEYWLSTVDTINSFAAYKFVLYENDLFEGKRIKCSESFNTKDCDRCQGRSVRPVIE